MRAPQFRRVGKAPHGPRLPRNYGLPKGPNPSAAKELRVKPFANIFALVEGLGVVTLHKTREEAEAALAAYRQVG